jgi:4-hydroxy-tetrahydrodipicolinate synthase
MSETSEAVARVRGIVVPVPTPFDGSGQIDEELFATMAAHYASRGVGAMFLFGSYGQGPAMSTEQRKRGLEVVLKAVPEGVTVIPQVGAVDPYTGRELAEHAAEHGAHALASVGPYYYADRPAREITDHFRFMFDGSDLPILIYNNARYQGHDITPRQLAEIREEIPAIFALKMAKGTLGELLKYRNALGDDIAIFAPQENLFPGMLMGQAGTISPPLTTAVELGLALVAAIDGGDTAEALRLQLALLQFASRMQQLSPYGRAVRAEGLRYIGFDVKEYPRWPTTPLPDDARQLLHGAIDEAKSAAAQ